MAHRVKIDDPGVMEKILEDIKTGPIEFWLELLDRYDNERPGDIILPGVPPSQDIPAKRIDAAHGSKNTTRGKKMPRRQREAA